MPLTIISIGKKHEGWVAEGIERYQKRLKAPFLTEWELIAPSGYDDLKARQDESGRILTRLAAYDFVILLDERGHEFDSPHLSTLLAEHLHHSRKVALVIGGAYGVDDTIRQKANLVWSLSPLVFPHQLVRLMLIEHLYRAQEIAVGHPYHHA
jgi:23S rRNA (pseudouridine1915-N3)-methyltransferase